MGATTLPTTPPAPVPAPDRPAVRIRALDGLRGAAVAAVFAFHAGHLRGGWLGVDLFFVLSGFLITGLLVDEHEARGGIGLGGFWARRARRLLPALGGLLLGVALYAHLWAEAAQRAAIRTDVLWTLGYAANWHAIRSGAGYWDAFVSPSPLMHAWSLAIEEQFYLVWPLVVLGVLRVARRPRPALLAVTLGLAATSLALMIGGALAGADRSDLYLRSDTRAFALLAGAALAITRPWWRARAPRAVHLLGIAAVGVLLWAWATLEGTEAWLYRGGLAGLGVLGCAAIAACAHDSDGPLPLVARWRPLAALGLISYGFYLWHWPVILVVTRGRTGVEGWALFGLRAVITLALALVSYFLLEQPIRHGALSARVALALAVAAPLVIIGATLLATREPVPGPSTVTIAGDDSDGPRTVTFDNSGFADLESRQYLPPGDWSTLSNYCDTQRAAPEEPVRTGGATRVMVVGDSVGCFIGAGMELQEDAYDAQVLNAATLGCLMARPDATANTDASPRPACADGWSGPLARFAPEVAVVDVGSVVVEPVRTDGAWIEPCSPEFAEWYGDGTRRSIRTLQAAGSVVAVISPVRPPEYVDIGPGVETPDRYREAAQCIKDTVRRVTLDEGAQWLDLDAWVCPGGECRDTIEGVELRSDGTHFMREAALLVGRWTLDHLDQLDQLDHLEAGAPRSERVSPGTGVGATPPAAPRP